MYLVVVSYYILNIRFVKFPPKDLIRQKNCQHRVSDRVDVMGTVAGQKVNAGGHKLLTQRTQRTQWTQWTQRTQWTHGGDTASNFQRISVT